MILKSKTCTDLFFRGYIHIAFLCFKGTTVFGLCPQTAGYVCPQVKPPQLGRHLMTSNHS